ncbi:UvrD-helicase domain-containing protein [Mycolicibacterium sp. OfavD-34-C]|uniref:UvrD-helicase domain-containing protein n=1 Tax=Mycolicibacterium sp. OfavD-34-C TaxID=2917746 RepID=UPI001EF4DE62|nr:UvrD-helicase domain-containing protein [Mycolicibacterium sp. OfavD-34-C]MCG7578803.1 AAA family ATPase [Mycolicibacterium sp. OfavD-34-C]
MSTDEIVLNSNQREVVEAAIDDRLLVIAGAGQGKTEVVALRIDHLVKEEQLSASAEVLVLSFSRAAVTAVKTRLNAREVPAANVRTFDSFAGHLIVEAGEEPAGPFEARIRRATQLLRDAADTPDPIVDLRHIVIDEVQDLVGDRADFVIQILRAVGDDVGITALGDPLQGVYDFQLRESRSKTASSAVMHALRHEFRCEELELGQNYRARGKDPKRVVKLGERLRATTDLKNADSLISELESTLLDLGEIDEWADLVAKDGVRSAVLCASNSDVLRVSRHFSESDIRHAVRRQAQDFGAANWIGRSLTSVSGQTIDRSEVEDALAEALDQAEIEQAWFLLKSVAADKRGRDALNLRQLRNSIRTNMLPLTLTEPDNVNVIVSTVHRAKGLEFDRVFLVAPNYEHEDADEWEIIRREYVALSRARDEIYMCWLPQSRSSFETMRWLPGRRVERVYNRKTGRKRVKAFEFLYDDVDTTEPTAGGGLEAADVQENLKDNELIGTNVEGMLDHEESAPELPSYLLTTEEGYLLGRTSESFNVAFNAAFGRKGGGVFPGRLFGLTLVSVETVAGEPRKTDRHGVGSSGLWLAPRVTGLVQPDWKTMEEVE